MVLSKVLSKELFDEIYRQVPRTCVEVLIKTGDGFVLSRRLIEPCIGMWHIPGGTVFFGERLYNAARRVAIEELGVKVNALGIVGVVNYLEIYEGKGQSVGIIFLCELNELNGSQTFQGSYQAKDIKIFHVDNIPEDTVPEHKKFLKFVELRGDGDNGIYKIFEYMEE